MPVSTRKAYDVRKVLSLIADTGSLFELEAHLRAQHGNGAGAARRYRPVGFIANQALRLGGMINPAGRMRCDKGAHFIALCDAFGLPLVSFIDVPGFSIGSSAERTWLGGAAPSWCSNGATRASSGLARAA